VPIPQIVTITTLIQATALILPVAIVPVLITQTTGIIPVILINTALEAVGHITAITPIIITIKIITTTARSIPIIPSLVMAVTSTAAHLINIGIMTTTIKTGAVGKTATTRHNLVHPIPTVIIKVGKILLQEAMDSLVPVRKVITKTVLTTNLMGVVGKARITSNPHKNTIMAAIPIRAV